MGTAIIGLVERRPQLIAPVGATLERDHVFLRTLGEEAALLLGVELLPHESGTEHSECHQRVDGLVVQRIDSAVGIGRGAPLPTIAPLLSLRCELDDHGDELHVLGALSLEAEITQEKSLVLELLAEVRGLLLLEREPLHLRDELLVEANLVDLLVYDGDAQLLGSQALDHALVAGLRLIGGSPARGISLTVRVELEVQLVLVGLGSHPHPLIDRALAVLHLLHEVDGADQRERVMIDVHVLLSVCLISQSKSRLF